MIERRMNDRFACNVLYLDNVTPVSTQTSVWRGHIHRGSGSSNGSSESVSSRIVSLMFVVLRDFPASERVTKASTPKGMIPFRNMEVSWRYNTAIQFIFGTVKIQMSEYSKKFMYKYYIAVWIGLWWCTVRYNSLQTQASKNKMYFSCLLCVVCC